MPVSASSGPAPAACCPIVNSPGESRCLIHPVSSPLWAASSPEALHSTPLSRPRRRAARMRSSNHLRSPRQSAGQIVRGASNVGATNILNRCVRIRVMRRTSGSDASCVSTQWYHGGGVVKAVRSALGVRCALTGACKSGAGWCANREYGARYLAGRQWNVFARGNA